MLTGCGPWVAEIRALTICKARVHAANFALICCWNVSFESRIIPRYVTSELSERVSPIMVIEGIGISVVFLVKRTSFVFLLENSRPNLFDHVCKPLITLCILRYKSKFVTVLTQHPVLPCRRSPLKVFIDKRLIVLLQ